MQINTMQAGRVHTGIAKHPVCHSHSNIIRENPVIKIARILHPTDFSDNSKPALQYASEFARQFNADLHLISVVDTRAMAGPEYLPVDFMPEYIKDLETQLAALTFNGMQHCKKIVRNVLAGTTSAEIIKYARDSNIDLIVMGTHGRTGLGHLIIGSVAENVVRKALCPVLTVCPASVLKAQNA
jgi:universal stress protein A